MQVDCYFNHQACSEESFAGRVAVIIDVLRATSTMITALGAGARAIIPQAQVEQALALRREMPQALLCGEREGEKLAGFELGNSPFEFTTQVVGGRIIIACTTNGTAAITKAISARQIWLGALLNGRAVAEKLLQQQVPALTLVCSGTDGRPSLDDTMAAGAILQYLSQEKSLDLSDSALMTLRLYQSYAGTGMQQVLGQAYHGRKLTRFGRGRDVEYCAQQDISADVPWLNKSDGRIYSSLNLGEAGNTP